jgi:DNA ligase-1
MVGVTCYGLLISRWMTEKYDGMRLYWDGNQFFTRQGKRVKIPDSVAEQLPSFALDGEIW